MAVGNVAELIVRIGGDVSALGNALKQAEGQINGFVAETEAAGAAIARLGLIAGAAGVAILAGLGVAVNAAAEAQRAQELLANAIRNSGKAIDQAALERLASTLQSTSGIADELILGFERLFIVLGATQRQTETLTPVALNMARALGVDAETAVRALTLSLQGNNRRLGLLLGEFGRGIDLSTNFEASLEKLQSRFKDSGASDLFISLGALRGAFGDLLEAIGAPILTPLTKFIDVLARLTATAAELAKTPVGRALSGAFAGFFAVLGVGLVALGIVGGLLALRGPIISGLVALAPLLLKNAAALALMGPRVLALAAAFRLLQLVMAIGIPGAIIGATVAITQGLLKNEGAFKDFNQAVEFSMLQFARWVTGALGMRDASENFDQAMQDLVNTQAKYAAGAKAIDIRNLALAQSFEELSERAKLVRLELEEAASVEAIKALEEPGADVAAIEARRQRKITEAQKVELKARIAFNEQSLKDLLKSEERSADVETELSTKLAEDKRALRELELKDTVKVAQGIVDAERQAARTRLEIDRETLGGALDLLQVRVNAEREIQDTLLRNEQESAQHRLDALRLEEDLRIAMLRRTIDIEQALGKSILSVKGSLFRTQQAQLETAAIAAASKRAQLVRDGFLEEAEAERQNAQDRADIQRKATQGEIALQQERLRQILRTFEVEQAFAVAAAESKKAILDAETQAQQSSLRTTQKLREIDLAASIKIAQAETRARIAEMKAQLDFRVKTLEAELNAARARGAAPEELQQRQDEIDILKRGFDEASDAFVEALSVRQDAARAQIEAGAQATNEQLALLDSQALQRRVAIDQELAATLLRLESQSAADRAGALEDLANQQVRLAQFVASEEERLGKQVEEGDITEAEKQRRLQPLKDLQSQITGLLTTQQTGVKTQLSELETLYKGFSERVTKLLEPVKALLDSIVNPLRQGQIPGAFNVQPGVVNQPGVAGALVGQAGDQFVFQGVAMNLTADETSLLRRIIERMVGPEGAAIFEQKSRSQPGR